MYIAAEPGGFFFSFFLSRAATGLAGEGLHEAAALVGEGDDGMGRMEGCFRAAFFFLIIALEECLRENG